MCLLTHQSYFAPAIQLSSSLSLKLAYKRYKTGTYPFSGFPVSQLDKYLKILVQDQGNTVVLVEEYPKGKDAVQSGKKTGGDEMIDRRVGRVVTPGTLLDESWLSGEESRYLLAIAVTAGRKGELGTDGSETPPMGLSLAYTDVSTGEFFSKDTTLSEMEDELARIAPREVVLDQSLRSMSQNDDNPDIDTIHSELVTLLRVLGVHISFADSSVLETSATAPTDNTAISLLRHHLQYALRDSMPELSAPNRQFTSKQMQIDAATLHALEIRHTLRPGGLNNASQGSGVNSSPLSARGTLLSVLNRTVTPSGHRLLVRTLTAPSTDISLINSRLSLVQSFVDRPEMRIDAREMIRDIGDVMRIIQRFRGRRGEGRDIWDVSRWIRSVDKILARIDQELDVQGKSKADEGVMRLQKLLEAFKPLSSLADTIERSIDEAALLRGTKTGEDDEEAEGIEAAGDALVASGNKKGGETRREEKEREKEEKDAAMWWIKPT
jgi:DNA mismatch repair ATPase MutS